DEDFEDDEDDEDDDDDGSFDIFKILELDQEEDTEKPDNPMDDFIESEETVLEITIEQLIEFNKNRRKKSHTA
ncbi:MAG: hypothetical protein IJ711_10650, partial [Lachnospiraceae bacterium]|nr:hypothetical protein [Lachnospiraceae bacterium]